MLMLDKGLEFAVMKREDALKRQIEMSDNYFIEKNKINDDILEESFITFAMKEFVENKVYLLGDMFYQNDTNMLYIISSKLDSMDYLQGIFIFSININDFNNKTNSLLEKLEYCELIKFNMDYLTKCTAIGNIFSLYESKDLEKIIKDLYKKDDIGQILKKINIKGLLNNSFNENILEFYNHLKKHNNIRLNFFNQEIINSNEYVFNEDEEDMYFDSYYLLELNEVYLDDFVNLIYDSQFKLFLSSFIELIDNDEFIMGTSDSIWIYLERKNTKKNKTNIFNQFIYFFNKKTMKPDIMFANKEILSEVNYKSPYSVRYYDVLVQEMIDEYNEELLKFL